MPLRTIEEEIVLLRDKARRMRELAAVETELSPDLREMAADLEAEAEVLTRKLKGFAGRRA